MIHHYITKYWDENNKHMAVSWLQINVPIVDWCICFSKRYMELDK